MDSDSGDLKRLVAATEQAIRLFDRYEDCAVSAEQTMPRDDQIKQARKSQPSQDSVEAELDTLSANDDAKNTDVDF